jgi:hypothetical protein
MKQKEWIELESNPPKVAVNETKYFKVKFEDGTEDEKPFRNRPSKNIFGFMSEKKVTHYKK